MESPNILKLDEAVLHEIVRTAVREGAREGTRQALAQLKGEALSDWLSPKEVADMARCTDNTVRAAIHAGEMKFRQKVRNGRIFVHVDEADRWIRAAEAQLL